jgi:hypothetical protein
LFDTQLIIEIIFELLRLIECFSLFKLIIQEGFFRLEC